MCLKELGRLPGPELENCVDRESYSVTAGLALGMITMGKGESLVSAAQQLDADDCLIGPSEDIVCSNVTFGSDGHIKVLLILGLNGHLSKLGKLESFDYLMKNSEPISIGLLLGVSDSRLGSMDVFVTKKLGTQLEALLPPNSH